MMIEGYVQAVVMVLVFLLAAGVGIAGTWAVLKHRVAANAENIRQLRQDYAKDIENLHQRINERRAELTRHIEDSAQVHASIATMAEAVNAIKDRLGRIEGLLDRKEPARGSD